MNISLKMIESQTMFLLLGDLGFFVKTVKIGKDTAYFKANGQLSVCGKERRYKEFTFLTSLISFSFLNTVKSMIQNVTSVTVFFHQAKKAHIMKQIYIT